MFSINCYTHTRTRTHSQHVAPEHIYAPLRKVNSARDDVSIMHTKPTDLRDMPKQIILGKSLTSTTCAFVRSPFVPIPDYGFDSLNVDTTTTITTGTGDWGEHDDQTTRHDTTAVPNAAFAGRSPTMSYSQGRWNLTFLLCPEFCRYWNYYSRSTANID